LQFEIEPSGIAASSAAELRILDLTSRLTVCQVENANPVKIAAISGRDRQQRGDHLHLHVKHEVVYASLSFSLGTRGLIGPRSLCPSFLLSLADKRLEVILVRHDTTIGLVHHETSLTVNPGLHKGRALRNSPDDGYSTAMCGRYSITAPAEALSRLFRFAGPPPNLRPRYNVAPT
jgi:hypothetical protein